MKYAMRLLLLIFAGVLMFCMTSCNGGIDYDKINPDTDLKLSHSIFGYGFVDEEGKTVIRNQFQEARVFVEGFAAVKKGGKWGYIDKTGKSVVPMKYLEARDYYKGYAVVMINKGSIWMDQYRYGIIDQQGTQIVDFIFSKMGNYAEGLACAGTDTSTGYGYIDEKGNFVIPQIYEDAQDFQNGVAKVRKAKGGWFTIDKTGQIVTEQQ